MPAGAIFLCLQGAVKYACSEEIPEPVDLEGMFDHNTTCVIHMVHQHACHYNYTMVTNSSIPQRIHGTQYTPNTHPHACPTQLTGSGFSVAFDPLDGSSIVDTNFSVGTIFGVWPGDNLTGITGRDQAAAGMGVYGPRTVFCIALKDAPGCHEFLLQDDGKWVHVKETFEIGRVHGGMRMMGHLCVLCFGCYVTQIFAATHLQ